MNYFVSDNMKKEIKENFFKFGRRLPLIENNLKEKKTVNYYV